MSPKKLDTKVADKAWGKGRLEVGWKYHEIAELTAEEGGAGINVCVGLCVLAGIAASDTISAYAIGERYSGSNHQDAASFLKGIDSAAGASLLKLVGLKPKAHYGAGLLTDKDRAMALRTATSLLEAAQKRVSPAPR